MGRGPRSSGQIGGVFRCTTTGRSNVGYHTNGELAPRSTCELVEWFQSPSGRDVAVAAVYASFSGPTESFWKRRAGGRARTALGGMSKRAVDVVVASLALVLLTPLFVVTGVLIRLLVGKPIIVVERSVGLGGEVFALYKFRTTPDDACSGQPNGSRVITEVLRASRIDKLPHLYNVVRGDMSLVGPELVGAQHALHFGIETPEILLARPGVVSVRHYVPRSLRAHRAEIVPDRLYILRWSMWLDLRIVCGALARIHAQDASRPAK